MPPLPPVAPVASSSKSIPHILSSLRSSIFQTAHNPEGARLGNKYLRRSLRGPRVVEYYPRKPNVKHLNAEEPWNPYALWRTGVAPKPVIGSGSGSGSGERGAEGEGQDVKGYEGQWKAKQLSLRERILGAGRLGGGGGGGGGGGQAAAGEEGSMGTTRMVEVARIPGAGWLDDAAERTRMDEVDLRRKLKKGPPTKGQGKRSQMKKR